MDEVFGPEYAKSLAQDLVMGALGERTANEALAAGVDPREVWEALCTAMDVPESARWAHRQPKPKRR
jgi:hypothetical protein